MRKLPLGIALLYVAFVELEGGQKIEKMIQFDLRNVIGY